MSERGKLITLEGVDGAGKSTHLQFIADIVGMKGEKAGGGGRRVVVTREPGGTPLAEKLRKAILEEPMDPVTATLLVFAARADHVARVIRPALEAGSWVVCDRFTDATVAYQGAGQGVPLELIEREDRAFFERVREAYLGRARAEPRRVRVIDASGDPAQIRQAVTQHLEF